MEIDKEPTPVVKGNVEKNVTVLLKAIFNLLTTGTSSKLITFYCL